MTPQTDPQALREQVMARYAAAAAQVTEGRGGCGCGQPADCGCDAGCCGDATAEVSGIGAGLCPVTDREALPDTAVLAGLGCGNPTAVAELREGETVIDLLGRRDRRPALRQAGRPPRVRPTGWT